MMAHIINDLCVDVDVQNPVRIPRDKFEASIFLKLIEMGVESWKGTEIRGKTVSPVGMIEALTIDRDFDENGWFSGLIHLSWIGKSFDPIKMFEEDPIWPDSIPVKFCLMERQEPASEHYRSEVAWEIEPCPLTLGHAQENYTPYSPTFSGSPYEIA
jgi:hypothetical protein